MSLSSGKKKMTKVEELAKKNQIKALNSFNDNNRKTIENSESSGTSPPPLSLSSPSHHVSPQTGSCRENQRRCERFFYKYSVGGRVRKSSVGNDSSQRNVYISYNSNPCWTWICNT